MIYPAGGYAGGYFMPGWSVSAGGVCKEFEVSLVREVEAAVEIVCSLDLSGELVRSIERTVRLGDDCEG